jgi:hypothetical protein
MTRIFFVAAVAFAALAVSEQPAAADYYGAPWCAVISMGDGDMQWDCEYQSLEACRPNVLAGNRGWCNVNPYMAATSFQPSEHKRTRKRRAQAQ